MGNNGLGGDAGLRAPMSWTGPGAAAGFSTVTPYRTPALNAGSFNVAAETGDPRSLLEFYRALYRVRQLHPVLATGSLRLLSRADDALLMFSRKSSRDTAYVAVNVSDHSQTATIETGEPNRQFLQAVQIIGNSTDAPITTDAQGRLIVRLKAKTPAVFVPVQGQRP